MAIQIVMDRTGDSRHPFNPNDAQALAKAEKRFYELTGVGFTAAVRTSSGEVSQVRSFDPPLKKLYFSLASLAVSGMFLVRRSTPEHQLFRAHGLYANCTEAFMLKIPRRLAACDFCETGFPQINEPSLMTRTTSKSSVATAGDDTGYIVA